MDAFVFVLIGVAVASGGALLAFAWEASTLAMHPPPAVPLWQLDDFPSLHSEAATITTEDGVRLAGRFLPGQRRSTIALSHGYGACQDEMLPVAAALHDAGFSVFTYDLRGCGSSGGAVTFGVREQGDLVAVIDYLQSRSDVDAERIGALGFSIGAAITILAAARDGRIRAVVDDSGWSDVYHWLRPHLLDVFVHPRERFTPLSLKLVELRARIRLRKLRPAAVIARLSPRPLLLIHGDADDVVRASDGEENFAAAGEPRKLWRVAARHGDTIQPGGATCDQTVAAFFERALALDC